eukprot:727030-Prorocentrum_minimum.AAC.1
MSVKPLTSTIEPLTSTIEPLTSTVKTEDVRKALTKPFYRLESPTLRASNYTRASCVRLVRRENMPAHPASDWSAVRICPRVLRPI